MYSNLGCHGPNQTYGDHELPCEIKYWNVFEDPWATPENVTYLIVTNLTTYEYTEDLEFRNGVTMETEEEAKIRWEQSGEDQSQIHGAYGQINMATDSETRFEFRLEDAWGTPVIPEKVWQMTFLDIDQPENARTRDDEEIGGEMVEVCTGLKSWGHPKEGQLQHNWTLNNETGEACHKFRSTTAGDPSDNPWNPARIQAGVVVGLEIEQLEKSFTAAYYNVSSFEFTLSVKYMEDYASRNFVYVGHPTSFCEEWKSLEVMEDALYKHLWEIGEYGPGSSDAFADP